MPKRLNGSAGTGKKIMKNRELFDYSFIKSDSSAETPKYYFNWSFEHQQGTAVITLTEKGLIDQSSTLNCDEYTREFARPLGAYNDPSLYDVFAMMLNDAGIAHK